MKRILDIILLVVVGVFAVSAIIAIFSALPIMLLWNWLMPDIFGLTTINFWQALGICFLSSCIFGRPSYNKKDKD